MSVSVRLPRELRQVYELPDPVEVEGGTVAEVIAALDDLGPGVAHRLVDAGRLRRHIVVFVGVGHADLDTEVPMDGDVTVVTAVAGG